MACGDDPPFIVAADSGCWSQGRGPRALYRGFEHRQETCLGTGGGYTLDGAPDAANGVSQRVRSQGSLVLLVAPSVGRRSTPTHTSSQPLWLIFMGMACGMASSARAIRRRLARQVVSWAQLAKLLSVVALVCAMASVGLIDAKCGHGSSDARRSGGREGIASTVPRGHWHNGRVGKRCAATSIDWEYHSISLLWKRDS